MIYQKQTYIIYVIFGDNRPMWLWRDYMCMYMLIWTQGEAVVVLVQFDSILSSKIISLIFDFYGSFICYGCTHFYCCWKVTVFSYLVQTVCPTAYIYKYEHTGLINY